MADEDDANRTEVETAPGVGGSNPPEARTPQTGAAQAANQYSKQADQHKGTQDPYPYDPTNELLDGDDSPSAEQLAARGVRISDSGRSLVPLEDPTGMSVPPPAHANLELEKGAEKVMRAADEAAGIDPEVGAEARRSARADAGKARLAAAKKGADVSAARSQAPSGRQGTPQATTGGAGAATKSTGGSASGGKGSGK